MAGSELWSLLGFLQERHVKVEGLGLANLDNYGRLSATGQSLAVWSQDPRSLTRRTLLWVMGSIEEVYLRTS